MDVSIITPMFHGDRYIDKISKIVKELAKNSNNVEIEWIIINDLPNTTVELPKIRQKNITLKYEENKINLGIQRSRIKGINMATGKYLLMLDQDDYISKNMINICLKKIGNSDVCITNGYSEKKKDELVPIFKSKNQMRLIKDIKYYFYIGNLIASPGMALIKKASIPKKWLNNPLNINGADDWLLWTMMLAEHCEFIVVDEKEYIHQKYEDNTSDNNLQMLRSSFEASNVFENEFYNYSRLVKKYKKRLTMRENYEENGKSKVLEYIKNPDIAFYLLKLKV